MKLRRMTARKSGDDEAHEPEGIEVHVSHDHLARLGLDKPPAAGAQVSLEARGHVSASHTEQVDGKPRHHMRITLTHAAVEPEGDGPDDSLRGELERNAKGDRGADAAAKGGKQ